MVVYTLGFNEFFQLSFSPDVTETSIPTEIPFFANKKITKIACGFFHTLILIQHKVYSYGCNEHGILGRVGYQADILEIPFEDEVIDISCGKNHSAVLTKNGIVYAWGSFADIFNRHGTNCCIYEHDEPHIIAENVIKIASCDDFIVMLDTSNDIYIYSGTVVPTNEWNWHANELTLNKKRITCNYIKYQPFESIKTGASHFFVLGGGKIYGFGVNKKGQLGSGYTNTYIGFNAINIKNVTDCDGGLHHSLFLLNGDKLYAAGSNFLGSSQSIKDKKIYYTPVVVMENVTAFACSQNTNLVAKGKELYTWGSNVSGQLGHADKQVCLPKLVEFVNDKKIIGLYAGLCHTIIVTED
ncbi:Regulator of chromosome condensation [Conglomerata obtusa]